MPGTEPSLLVVGGVTLDTIHLPGQASPVSAPGGAGLFTTLGALEAGGICRLFAQRPNPFPESFRLLENLDWIGPEIPLAELPRLEIAHYGGGRAELLHASWGAQLRLSPADLPAETGFHAAAHIAALGPTAAQLRFVRACREMGVPRLSAGTYGRAAHGEPEAVHALIAHCDYFFMNENEARALFGALEHVQARAGQAVFVTCGAEGARVVTRDGVLAIPAPPVDEVNPTGAGDTFCGAVLAGLLAGRGLPEAVETGVRLAAARVSGAVWSPSAGAA